MPGQLPQPLVYGGPQGVADIETYMRDARFIPGLVFLLRQRGADMDVLRRTATAAPLAQAAPTPADTARAARNVYGNFSGLAPARAALPSTHADTDGLGNVTFLARCLLIDDEWTEADRLFSTSFQEQRLITLADLHPGDLLRYRRDDGRLRSYEVTSPPMALGGTTEILRQFTISAATE